MRRKQSREIRDRNVYFLGGRGSGLKVVSDVFWKERQVEKYSFALIDTQATYLDNGRILGYDTAHGYAHRHYKGEITPTHFSTFDQALQAFEADVKAYLEGL